jgi:hypothetical protein
VEDENDETMQFEANVAGLCLTVCCTVLLVVSVWGVCTMAASQERSRAPVKSFQLCTESIRK